MVLSWKLLLYMYSRSTEQGPERRMISHWSPPIHCTPMLYRIAIVHTDCTAFVWLNAWVLIALEFHVYSAKFSHFLWTVHELWPHWIRRPSCALHPVQQTGACMPSITLLLVWNRNINCGISVNHIIGGLTSIIHVPYQLVIHWHVLSSYSLDYVVDRVNNQWLTGDESGRIPWLDKLSRYQITFSVVIQCATAIVLLYQLLGSSYY